MADETRDQMISYLRAKWMHMSEEQLSAASHPAAVNASKLGPLTEALKASGQMDHDLMDIARAAGESRSKTKH